MIIGIAIGDPNLASNIVLVKRIETVPNFIKQVRNYIKPIDTSIILAIIIIKLTAMTLGLLGTIPLWLIVGIGDDGATLIALTIITTILAKQ